MDPNAMVEQICDVVHELDDLFHLTRLEAYLDTWLAGGGALAAAWNHGGNDGS